MTRIPIVLVLSCFVAAISAVTSTTAQANSSAPVLVELFTSEGCSSCPPADSLLQQLDREQPVSGAQVIVFSEHVDYWNHIGWKDPYSSSFFSDRQNAYVNHFGLGSAYTPQMIVDGTNQFVGNDRRAAEAAITKARAAGKIRVRLSDIAWNGPSALKVHIEADPVPNAFSGQAEVFLATALDHAESQVLHGENEGRRLTHTAVILSLVRVGRAEKGKNFSADGQVKLDAKRDLRNLRVIAFVQEAGPGRVLGADMQHAAQ